MRPHDEDQEEDLRQAEDLAAEGAQQDLAGVGHIVHPRVAGLELPVYEAGVGGQDAEDEDEDETTADSQNRSGRLSLIGQAQTYGTMPMVARTEGRDRMPREMVSAIMTWSRRS